MTSHLSIESNSEPLEVEDVLAGPSGAHALHLVQLPTTAPRTVAVCLARQARGGYLKVGSVTFTLSWDEVADSFPVDWEVPMFELLQRLL